MLRALDDAPINRRYVILMGACMVGAVLDLFDFFLIAFVVPILNDEWSLTFGEATAMLLSAGFGAIVGSIIWGRLGESHGRRRPLIAGLTIFSLGTGAMALAPDEGWWFITIFRFIVGAGVAGVAVIAVPMVLEFTPTRLRTRIVGFVTTAMVPIGILGAAGAAAALDPNWRAIFLLGLLPLISVAFTIFYVRESPRWLLDQGRNEEARGVIAWLTMRDESELSLEADVEPERQTGYRELLRYRSSVVVTTLAWIGASAAVAGVFLWGPSFLEQILDVDSDEAAALFVIVILGAFAGRLFFSFFPQRVGAAYLRAADGDRRAGLPRRRGVQRRDRDRRRLALPDRARVCGLLRRRRLRQPRAVHVRDLPDRDAHARHGPRVDDERPGPDHRAGGRRPDRGQRRPDRP